MKNQGWTKLHRSLLEWEWYDDPNTTRLLIHLILTVNFEQKKWHGIEIMPGQRVASWGVLSKELKLSVKSLRTSMDKLERCGEVARRTAGKIQLVTLVKWDKLQGQDEQGGRETGRIRAGKGQDKGRERATTKECKELKESKEPKNNIPNGIDSMFLEIFNRLKKELMGKGEHKVLSKTDLNNLKNLKKKFDWPDFEKVIRRALVNQYVKENNLAVPAHVLREANFIRYFDQEDKVDKLAEFKAGMERAKNGEIIWLNRE